MWKDILKKKVLNPTQTDWQGVPTSANFMFV